MGSAFDAKGHWTAPATSKYGAGVDVWGWGVVAMGMALSTPLYGGVACYSTALKLVKVFGMMRSDIPAFNPQVKSLEVVFAMEGRGRWPETYFTGQPLSLMQEALRFNPCDRPSAELITRCWGSIEGGGLPPFDGT